MPEGSSHLPPHSRSPAIGDYYPKDKPGSGERVIVTKLMLKLMSTDVPNYVVAAAAKIHPTTLSLYARGKKPISAAHLIALQRVFECEPDDLIGEIEVEIA
jgi:hypothetical protein